MKTNMFGLLHNLFNKRFTFGCALIVILLISQTANAGYIPPRSQKPPGGYSDSSGVR
ncbi:MAG: hypothetical protein HC908_04625 [Calothrix sp. SM1_7_51]|nr:hypothetical protein [Calothrix sp. SM1_7_51]